MTVKFSTDSGAARELPFLHLEIQPSDPSSKTKEHSPDYWGKSRNWVDPLVMYTAMGAPAELIQQLRALHVACGLPDGRIPVATGGWDAEYATGTQYIRITSNRFVGAERADTVKQAAEAAA